MASLVADSRVELPDTALWQGQRAILPIWGQLQLSEGPLPLRLVLLYSANRLRILRVFAEPPAALCEQVSFQDTVLDGDTGRVEIGCMLAVGGEYRGVLGWLELEVLAGRDTVGWIRPVELIANGGPLPLDGQGAQIRILGGPPVEPVGAEGVWMGAPNPFSGELVVHYSVARPGRLLFRLFSLSGREVPVEPSVVEVGRPGTYTLRFRFVPWELSSGGYVVQMVTQSGGVYFLPVMCVK